MSAGRGQELTSKKSQHGGVAMWKEGVRALGIAFLAVMTLTGCPSVITTANNQAEAVAVANYDVLNDKLAQRVRTVLGVSDTGSTTQVLVTSSDGGIGSIYRTGGRWIPYDDTSCTFPEPKGTAMPTAFPSYQISKTLAADIGLDNALIQTLAKFSVNLSDSSSFSFSIDSPTLKVVSDTSFHDGLQKPGCQQVLKSANGDLYVVRGYVSGKRTFTTSVDATRLVQAGITKIGTFNINAGGGKTVLQVTDSVPTDFLQILELQAFGSTSASSPTVVAAIPPPPPPAPPPPLATLPTATSGTDAPPIDNVHDNKNANLIYIQQNTADGKTVGADAKKLLTEKGFSVAQGVESLDKTPGNSQVRYFRDADRAAADQVAATLRSKFGNIEAIRSNIPGVKTGQLEVWLSKQP